MRYVVVTGGAISGVGKGVTASSTALILRSMGYRVTMIKIDPNNHIPASTRCPREHRRHGEIFVLEDGGQTSLDLGNYERHLGITLTREHHITAGNTGTPAFIPSGAVTRTALQSITICDRVIRVAKIPVDGTQMEPELCVIELGGTIGDINQEVFVAALKRLRTTVSGHDFAHILVSFVPVVDGEQKMEPTLQSIRLLAQYRFLPHLVACRCHHRLQTATIRRIAQFCCVDERNIFDIGGLPGNSVPSMLSRQNFPSILPQLLQLPSLWSSREANGGIELWADWEKATDTELLNSPDEWPVVSIVLVGRWPDVNQSLCRALCDAAFFCKRKLEVHHINTSDLDQATRNASPDKHMTAWGILLDANGIVVPGGFGSSGTSGMKAAAQFARIRGIPFLGVGLGMQVAAIEFASNVCAMFYASSSEFMEESPATRAHLRSLIKPISSVAASGAGEPVRLGRQETVFKSDTSWSKVRTMYSAKRVEYDTAPRSEPRVNEISGPIHPSLDRHELVVRERHSHLYTVDPGVVPTLENHGLHFVGTGRDGLMHVFEMRDHRWFVGVQFHPEYTSTVLEPNRCILGFLAASAGCLDKLKDVGDAPRVRDPNDYVVQASWG